MAHEFKPGDLALIAKGQQNHSENLGRVVSLRMLVPDDGWYRSPGGLAQWNTSGSTVWVVEAEGLTNPSGATGWAQCAPANLMPLKGDGQPAQVRQAERVQ